MNILFLEAYYGGSHRAFADGWRERSRHDIRTATLPARKWKWRMQTAAWVFAEEVNACGGPKPDLVFATDMVNLAEFRGLTRESLAGVPMLLYFHENQYSYPPQVEGKPDFAWGVINAASALAADGLVFNSAFHRDDFFVQWRRGNRIMPDRRLDDARIDALEHAAEVVPVGIDFGHLDDAGREAQERDGDSETGAALQVPTARGVAPHPTGQRPGAQSKCQPPLIVWNHRWEHDKNPEGFFEGLREVKGRGLAFRVAVCGEAFPSRPECFDAAREEFADEVVAWGFLESRGDYARLLWDADVVVSTARQEFLGISTLEALWCGCYPLLPRRLSYPGLIPPEQHERHLYGSDAELADGLSKVLADPASHLPYAPRQSFLSPYAWPAVAARLDDLAETQAAERTKS